MDIHGIRQQPSGDNLVSSFLILLYVCTRGVTGITISISYWTLQINQYSVFVLDQTNPTGAGIDNVCEGHAANLREFVPKTNDDVWKIIDKLEEVGVDFNVWIRSKYSPIVVGDVSPHDYSWVSEAIDPELWFATTKGTLEPNTATPYTVLRKKLSGKKSITGKHMVGEYDYHKSTRILCAEISLPTTEPPTTEQHTTETHTTVQPTTEPLTTEQPTTELPRTETPTTEPLTTETPTTEPLTTETPTTEPLTTETPTTEPLTTEQPTTEPPTTETPTTETPTTETPTTEPPTTETPTTETPTTEPHTTESSTAEQTTTDPKTVQSTTEKHTTEQHTTEERITDHPTTEQRTAQQTAELSTTERLTTELSKTEPPTKQQTITQLSITTAQQTKDLSETKQPKYVQTTNSSPSSKATSSTSNLPVIVCPCKCPPNNTSHNNVSEEILREMINDLQRTLKVDTGSLSSNVRRKTSANDNRSSSLVSGVTGVTLLALTFGTIFILDIVHLAFYVFSKIVKLRKRTMEEPIKNEHKSQIMT